MNRICRICFLCLLCFPTLQAQKIGTIGQKNSLEIANWNLEWYGKTSKGYGPDDDQLQQKLILNLLDSTNIDVWGLCEITDTTQLKRDISSLKRYQAIFSAYAPEQKTAVLIDTSWFKIVSYQLLGTDNPDSFSTQRFPLHVTAVSKKKPGPDTLNFVVIHLKANTGTDAEKMAAYNSRTRSAEWLRMYLNTHLKNSHTVVMGDWNDDVDQSIYNHLPSPFNILKKNGFPYSFITESMSQKGIPSTVSYSDFIDHQLISSRLHDYWINDSCKTIPGTAWISDYANLLSDHLPVYSIYDFNRMSLSALARQPLKIYPNPSNNLINFDGIGQLESFTLYDTAGRQVKSCNECVTINISDLNPGVYWAKIIQNGKNFELRLLVE